jgi:hypothetical protein
MFRCNHHHQGAHYSILLKLHLCFLYRALCYNYVMLTNKKTLFEIVLIHFFVSSTCFQYLMFIFRKTIFYMQVYMFCFLCICASSLAVYPYLATVVQGATDYDYLITALNYPNL